MTPPDQLSQLTPAPERATVWLRAYIGTGKWQPGDRLPTLETLAHVAGVSRRTMAKAVAILVAENLVTARRGRGIVLGAGDTDSTEETGSSRSIVRLITEAVFSGEFLPGMELPPIAKLQLRFDSCYRTIHKALATLTRQRVLVRTASRYTVPTALTHGVRTEIILFNEAVYDNDRQRATVLITENLTQRMGVKFLRYEHSVSMPVNTVEVQRLVNREGVAGFMIDFWGVDMAERAGHFNSLMSVLYACRKPISVIDQVGTLKLEEPLRSSSRVREFTIAAHVAGEDIGRALLDAGHQKVAYLTTTANQPWSQRRFVGLKRLFARAGRPDSAIIQCEAAALPGSYAPLVCGAARLSRKQMELLLRPRLPKSEFEQMIVVTAEIAEMLNIPAGESRRIRDQLQTIIDLAKAGGDPSIIDVIRDRLFTHIGSQIENRLLTPFFQNLMSDRSITAWVASREGIGLAAHAFLETQMKNKAGVPALVSFDNGPQATMAGLSSYDFDIPGLLHQALSFALGRKGTESRIHKAIEWPGMLCVRQSMRGR
jgi:DNA-binding transcriptional regulator YhcF (GntR family)